MGISNPEQAVTASATADGVVVGSALVNCIRDNLEERKKIPEALRAKCRELVAGVKRQADGS